MDGHKESQTIIMDVGNIWVGQIFPQYMDSALHHVDI